MYKNWKGLEFKEHVVYHALRDQLHILYCTREVVLFDYIFLIGEL